MIILGIDGGGSKTAFLLEDDFGGQLARFVAGPSNWMSAGAAVARQSIAAGIERLPVTPHVVCAGFAGAGRPEGRELYQDVISSLLPRARIIIETDAFIAYVGALGVEPGVLLIAGTGSIALARQPDGVMRRTGGWGPVFGDEGSGFWIGREAVRTALRAHDAGLFPDFVGLVTQALSQDAITDVVGKWNSGILDVRSIASLAAVLIENEHVEPAERILRGAASALRSVLDDAIQVSGLPADCRKSITGSAGRHPSFQRLIGADFVPPAHPPEQGAILWARARIEAS